ncbi:hypothetical protein EDB86DRAFT_3098556 [Lactarius hatsudake]|nr:hypothetical protein EDB86DRAFT_3098556 [Lactarius hatsudake]
MDFSKSIYWCGMPAVRAHSLAPASLCLAHNTLAITLSLSYPHSDVPIHPFMRGRGGVRECQAGIARAEGVDTPTLPLVCAGGRGLDWHGLRGGVGTPSLLS